MKKALLLNDTSCENHLGSKEVVSNLRKLCAEQGIELIGAYSRKSIASSNLSLQEDLKKVDLIIINGEGTLHRSTPYTWHLLEFCKNKKSILINTVWEKMYIKDKKIFDNVLLVSVRESLSYEQIIKTIDKNKVHIVPDLIFYTDPAALEQKIGYGDSFMDYLRSCLSVNGNYFPMEFTQSSPSLGAYLAWMRGLDLFITGRFHGLCLAAMIKKPFLAFASNSHKIEGLLKDMGCPELLLESFDNIECKKEIAKKAIDRANNYALRAKAIIKDFFEKVENEIGLYC